MTSSTDRYARILDGVTADTDAMVELLAELIRIPSVGGSAHEYHIQALIADWMRHNGMAVDHWQLPLAELARMPEFPGMEVDREQAWGVVGRLPGTGGGPVLMLNGHVDVVPPGDVETWTEAGPFDATVRGDTLYGRGACDMKAGLVAALFAARALHTSGVRPRGDLLVAAVAGEEDGGLGSFGLLQRGWRADGCIITEPTGLDIVPANGGALTFRIRVPGRAAHASRRTVGRSAVERFWPIFRALRELEEQRNRDVDPLMNRWDIAYPIDVGTVTAGDWASTVPDTLIAEGRLGVALGETMADARSELAAAVAEATADDDDWSRTHPVTVEWWGGQFAAGRSPEADGGLVAALRSAHAEVVGSPAGTWGAPYGSDLRLLSGLGGIPTVQYGPGDISQAHAANESVPISQLIAATKALAVTAAAYCR